MAPTLQVVWNAKLRETDWIRYLLSSFRLEDSYVRDLSPPTPQTLYIFSSNVQPLSSLSNQFLTAVRDVPGVGLFHASDEWFSQDYRVYNNFSYVLRTHWAAALAKQPRLMIVPLGWPNGTLSLGQANLASSRELVWFFAGNSVATRPQMIRALRHITPNVCLPYNSGREVGPLSSCKYIHHLRESIFCPAPMGNVMAETWRVYESLAAGCIPILESRYGIDYFRSLFGAHPIPTFNSWAKAAVFMRDQLDDLDGLDRLQSRVQEWWNAYEADLPARIARFIESSKCTPGHCSVTGVLNSNHTFVRRAWAGQELMKHHSLEALARRFALTLERAITR